MFQFCNATVKVEQLEIKRYLCIHPTHNNMFFFFDSCNSYDAIRESYVANPQRIDEFERAFDETLLSGIKAFYHDFEKDFNAASVLSDYWIRYAPRQRGRDASNEATPWGEVGEKTLDASLYRFVSQFFPNARFPGLPYGHDVRFMTEDAFVHIDIKSTGPNDSPDDIVLSLNQISGDGLYVNDNGVFNCPVTAPGPRKELHFQPELPPFYIFEDRPRLTLTFFIKCAYDVFDITHQPLKYLELICVPNGLIMFDTIMIKDHQGVFAAGKDTQDFANDKRVRIKLNPLSAVAPWRCVRITNDNGVITVSHRQTE